MKFLRLFLVTLTSVGLLAGCGSNDINDNTGGRVAFSLFQPATTGNVIVPVPNNLFFADASNTGGAVPGFTTDSTINLPNDPAAPNPLVTNVNLLDGFSTTDNIFTDILFSDIDLDSANQGGVLLINANTGTALTPGVDFDVIQSSVALGRTRLLIRPLRPLAPATTYVVIVTDALRTVTGGDVLPSQQFQIVANPNPVGSDGNPAAGFSADQQALLEQIRKVLVRPIFDGVIDPNPNLSADTVVIAWNFTTQSISDTLDALAATPTPNPNGAADGGIRITQFPASGAQDADSNGTLSTGELGIGLADTADIYQGTVDINYYLANNDNATANPPDPLTTFFLSDATNGAQATSALPAPDGGAIPCAAFAPSLSTTRCFPNPSVRSVETIPVLVTVPGANSPSGGTPPPGGWPVVIFQHGITANRTNLLTIAPTLAAAGFVGVAIDIPLHGVVPNPGSPSPFDIFALPGQERSFGLDVMPADGVPDSSGANFINLGNPITARDSTREAVIDLINLNATLRAGDITVTGGAPINVNGNASQYIGHSLGAIIGGVLLGVTDEADIDAATLANPGGAAIRLLDASASFGPVIAGGLASAAGVQEGTEDYESFLRFGQTINDPADPVNYAVAANANHDIHLLEIVGGANGGANPPDLVVPNFSVTNVQDAFTPPAAGACPTTANATPFLDTVCVGAPLAGTDPLVNTMGLNMVTISPPFAAGSQPADTVVRITSGHHSSILDPSTGSTPPGSVDPAQAAATTAEIQCETAFFLAQAAAGSDAPMILTGPACPPGGP